MNFRIVSRITVLLFFASSSFASDEGPLPEVVQPEPYLPGAVEPSQKQQKLASLVQTACQPGQSEEAQRKYGSQIFDLLEIDRINPDGVLIVMKVNGHPYTSPLLAYAIHYCSNVFIIRLLAKSYSPQMRRHALEDERTQAKVKNTPDLCNCPYLPLPAASLDLSGHSSEDEEDTELPAAKRRHGSG